MRVQDAQAEQRTQSLFEPERGVLVCDQRIDLDIAAAQRAGVPALLPARPGEAVR